MEHKQKTRIAAIGDIHIKETSRGIYHNLFTEISQEADILVLCGDLTDHGTKIEAAILAHELQSLKIPAVAVFGNHDFESGQNDEVRHILQETNLILLEDENFEMNDVGFTGVKGFGGGFGRHLLSPFGEQAIKDFANEAIHEALVLEQNLGKLQTKHKIVALHYSPIRDTIEGEPLEIFPFLGTSRLEETINRFDNVTTIFHGHADLGTHEGKTSKGVPVYNVALPLMKRTFPKKPYAVIEV